MYSASESPRNEVREWWGPWHAACSPELIGMVVLGRLRILTFSGSSGGSPGATLGASVPVLLTALLLTGCATEKGGQAPVTEPPEASPTKVEGPPEEPTSVERVRRRERSVEEAPELRPRGDHDGIVEVHFASGEARLDRSSRERLDRLCSALGTEEVDFYVHLQGHTDAVGAEEANLELGEERARVVREYLHRAHGIPLDRMEVTSLGSKAPAAENGTAAGRRQNRRVLVVVIRSPDRIE